MAYWNDTEVVTGGTVEAGSLDLSVEDSTGVVVGPWDQLTLASMAPGESVAASLILRNTGTTPFSLVVEASGVGDLLPGIDVALQAGVSPTIVSTTYPRAQQCGAVQDRQLSGAPSWSVTQVVQPRATLQLCLRLVLRYPSDNALQGKSVTPSFRFTATQVRP